MTFKDLFDGAFNTAIAGRTFYNTASAKYNFITILNNNLQSICGDVLWDKIVATENCDPIVCVTRNPTENETPGRTFTVLFYKLKCSRKDGAFQVKAYSDITFSGKTAEESAELFSKDIAYVLNNMYKSNTIIKADDAAAEERIKNNKIIFRNNNDIIQSLYDGLAKLKGLPSETQRTIINNIYKVSGYRIY